MEKLTRSDLWSLEEYAERRADFRNQVMAHKKQRTVHIGPNVTLQFEDRMTMQYQIQEMLRIERIFEAAGINEELEVYNPLIPDGSNWKATMMIEFPDIDERRRALERLAGIEHKIWTQVSGFERVFAIADEDLERGDERKTSAVHFMRFELTPEMVVAAKQGAEISIGVDHPAYQHVVSPLPETVAGQLRADLETPH
ncbi:MAG: DUF3501 family protein [Gammaproteobacteria bacterium]